jgi:hypothetical protein
MKRNLSNQNAQDSWRHTYFVKGGCVRRTYLTKDILKQKDAFQLLIKFLSKTVNMFFIKYYECTIFLLGYIRVNHLYKKSDKYIFRCAYSG